MRPNLSIEIPGLKLKNPLILASGILGLSGKLLRKVGDSGAGAVVTKSAGLSPRKGYEGPVIVEVNDGLLNSLGLPNPGIEEMTKEICEAKKDVIPVIASVYGFDVDEYIKVAKTATKSGADAIELNVSCPHVREVAVEIGQDPALISEVVKGVKNVTDKPVIVKLSPNVTDIVYFAKIVEKAGADAITAINTVRAMYVDIDIKRPVLSRKIGGLSGRAIKPIAIRCVYEIYKEVKIPIIGCGGISDWRDVIEYLLVGASAVQIGTSILYEDIRIFKKIQQGIKKYMQRKRLDTIESIIGGAHE